MKRALCAGAIVLVLGGTAARLSNRWREERADQNVTLLVDWSEVREATVRQRISDEELLGRLKQSGVSALLIGAATVQDYLWRDFTWSSRAAAETVLHQLLDRGVADVALKSEGKQFKLVRSGEGWPRLKDMEVGFDPEILGKARQAGLDLVLRVNNDPWLTKEKLFTNLQEISAANAQLGFLLNTDEVPGGTDALPQWKTLLESQSYPQLLFEFHPAKSSLKLGYRSPQSTFRAHTIASNELKDLTLDQQKSRWHRAVQERACRFLLFHLSPIDSLSGFLEDIQTIHDDLTRQGWTIGWPKPRMTWSYPSFLERRVAPLVALLLAIVVPIAALRWGLGKNSWESYFQITGMTLVGACVMAAVAQNPLTRVEIVPFSGIKLAFTLAWLGSFLTLYSWKEIQSQLHQAVRRVDVVVGLVLAAALGYVLLRTGNVGSGWQAGWEQSIRDRLEDLLVARPRFKEFAIGYPLLIVGLRTRQERFSRLCIGLGMIGPISMVNTFCHLHSPLYLAFWRSLNGFLIGTLVGVVLLRIKTWGTRFFEA